MVKALHTPVEDYLPMQKTAPVGRRGQIVDGNGAAINEIGPLSWDQPLPVADAESVSTSLDGLNSQRLTAPLATLIEH
jgi:hypothetical protein